MKKCLFVFIIVSAAFTACISVNSGVQGVDLVRGPVAGHIPAAEQISPDGQKVTSEYRVSIPLYKW